MKMHLIAKSERKKYVFVYFCYLMWKSSVNDYRKP